MAETPKTPPPKPPAYVLRLVPVADPGVRYGGPPRDPDYRLRGALKVLLRSFGFRCVEIKTDPPPGAGVPGTPIEDR